MPLPHFCSVTNNRIVREQDRRPRRIGRAPGGPAIRIGVARTGHWPGGGAAPAGCRAPHPAGAGRFLRRVRPIGSPGPRPGISRSRRRRADSAGVSIDRVQEEPSGGAGVGHRGDGADVASRPSGEGCGPWRGVGPEGPVRGHILRKEVIQPQVPLRLPCYDLVPITGFTFGACL